MESQNPNLRDDDTRDHVLTVMRDILDMLTREKMEILVHAVKLLPIDTPSLLSSLADLVYEKALEENSLCSTVASFCRALSKLTVRIEESDDDGKEVLKFSRLIIDKCQWEFERNHMEDATSASSESENDDHYQPQDDNESEKANLRQRSLLNIKFIGELYNVGMLAPTIMERIIETFIAKGDDESLASLYAFISTISTTSESHSVKYGKLKMFLRHFQSASDVVTSEPTADERVIALMRDLAESWQNNNNWSHQKDTMDNDMLKRLRGILNDLAYSNLDQIVLAIQQTPICTPELLSTLADLVYEKAVNEHSFSSTIARLCQSLTNLSVQTELENDKTEIPFNRLIIKRCQTEFEKEIKKEVKTLRMAEIQGCTDLNRKLELELQWVSEEIKLRQRALGNVRFIGELYNLHMLSPSIIMQIIATLMSNCGDENLEYVCTLLTTVGKVLELQSLQEKKLMLDLNDCFRQLKCIANDTSACTRVCYVIQEVLDLRENRWFPLRNIPVDDHITNSRGRDQFNDWTIRGVSNIKPGWDPADVFLVEHPHRYKGDGPVFVKPKPLGGYSSNAGWLYHEDLSMLHPIDRQYIPQNRKMNVEFDLNRGQEKFVEFHEHSETFRNILQWILNHQDQITDSPGKLSIDFITYIGRLLNIMRTQYNPQLVWQLCATEFKGTVYMANDLMDEEECESESDEEDDDEESKTKDDEEESGKEDGESQKKSASDFKMELWGHTFEHYMRGGNPKEGVDCVKSYRCFLKTSVGGHTLLYAPKMDGVDPDLFEDNFESMDAFISLKCCKELTNERKIRNFKRFKLRNWWEEHLLTGNPRIIVGYRNDDELVHTLEMLKTEELPLIAEGFWDPNVGFNFLVKFLDFVKSKVHTDPGKVLIFKRELNGHIYCKKLNKRYYLFPTWYTNKLFATDSPESV